MRHAATEVSDRVGVDIVVAPQAGCGLAGHQELVLNRSVRIVTDSRGSPRDRSMNEILGELADLVLVAGKARIEIGITGLRIRGQISTDVVADPANLKILGGVRDETFLDDGVALQAPGRVPATGI